MLSPRATRLLAGTVVVALIGLFLIQVRNQRDARADAEIGDQRFRFSDDALARLGELRTPMATTSRALVTLESALREHITASSRPLAIVVGDRRAATDDLTELAERLVAVAAADPVRVPPLLRGGPADAWSRDADAFARRVAQLAPRLDALADHVERWGDAVTTLHDRARAYVAAVEGHEPTDDPSELAAIWESERAPLAAYAAAVAEAEATPGLGVLAAAHRDYVDANAEWIDRAVLLLRADDLDAYNRGFAERFGQPDPFGAGAAIAEATEATLRQGAFAEIAELERLIADHLATLEVFGARLPATVEGQTLRSSPGGAIGAGRPASAARASAASAERTSSASAPLR